jgi:hypothetical protein
MKRLAQILVILLALGIVTVAGAAVYLFTMDGLESIINRRLASLVDGRYNLEVQVGRVTGDILSGVVLEEVRVHYVDSTRRYLLADIPRITTAYAFSNLWRRNFKFEYLFVDSAEVTLVRDSVDGWLLPTIPVRSDSTTSAAPSFSVQMLGLNGVSVRVIDGDDTLGIEQINLALALQSAEGTYGVSVEHLRFTSADQRLHLDAGGGKVTYSGGRLVFQDLLMHAGDTHLRLGGSVTTAKPLEATVTFDLDNVDLAELSTFIGPRLRGVVDLNGQATLLDGQLSGSADIGGDFMIASFENLHADFRLIDKMLHLDTLYGTFLQSCGVDGSGVIDFSTKPEQYHLSADLRNFNLAELIKRSFHSDLNGRLELSGESFRKKSFRLKADVDLFDSEYHAYHFSAAAGKMVITVDSLEFVEGFRIDYHENSFLIAGQVEYKGTLT